MLLNFRLYCKLILSHALHNNKRRKILRENSLLEFHYFFFFFPAVDGNDKSLADLVVLFGKYFQLQTPFFVVVGMNSLFSYS